MDRFVTRTPTWRTLNYSSFGGQKCVIKNGLKSNSDNKKKPLKQKQICEISHHSFAFDKQISNLLQPSQHTYTENFNANSNDSGLSSASSTSPQQMDGIEPINNRTIRSPTRKHIEDCELGKENVVYMALTRMPKPCQSTLESDLQGERTLEMNGCFNTEVNDTSDKPLLKANKMILARIQRDLDSPSAAVRMKALKAIKSPTKSAYCHFDITYTEQSLHLPEPPSLEEIMRNIVVYVEVRSGEDNRSAGVRKVIEALGARVSLSLNRETTHVIFKDGLLSTFKKATQMNIPIVSILWIEACKNQRRICDPKEYPISNLDRYENPELYTKMKRVKSMQPDSECNKRIRAKPGGTPKDSTPTQKTGTSKKTSAVIGGTPTSSKNKKKTDISQFFRKIEKPTILSISKGVCGVSSTKAITDPPAIQPLNAIHSESNNSTSSVLHSLHVDDAAENIKSSLNDKIVAGVNATIGASSQPNIRRCSILHNFEMDSATHSMNTMAISPTKIAARNRCGRRSSIHSPRNMSLVSETPSGTIGMESILEECDEMEKERNMSASVVNKRRTLYTIKTIDQTEYNKPETIKKAETASKKSCRRTVYASKTMEISDIKEVANTDKINNISHRRRTSFNFKTLEETPISKIADNKISNGKIISLTNGTERDIPSAAKAETPINCRRTLYDSKTIGETNVTKFATNITDESGDYQTPKNFRKGRVSSSTLLDDNDSRNNFVTPKADLTNDKLLEETEQCATPLVFSSTRKPGNKRRTLFDASMDIITQRLQCINQSARRSLVPSTSALRTTNTLKSPIGTPIHNVGTSNTLHDRTTPTTSVELFNEFPDNDCKSVVSPKLIKKKRRKLFFPNEMTITPTYTAIASSVNTPFKTVEQADKATTQSSKGPNDISVNKRRRTLMPISQPQPTTIEAHMDSINIAAPTPTVKKRRSTLDFEDMPTNKTKDSLTEIIPLTQNANPEQFATKKRTPVLAYTNMHQQQIDAIREAIGKLSVFALESSVTSNTTHLVSLEPRRTINLLRALARGLWILNYSWITDSFKAEKWLPEELYELKNFSRAVEICRSEHQAFGNQYKCELFRDVGGFYISSHCSPISKENICELISLCGGQIVNARKKARYIIGDDNKTLEDKLYLTPYWILDSITQMKLMKATKYAYCASNKIPASQPLQLEGNN